MKRPSTDEQKRGHMRLACGDPCDVFFGGFRRKGTVWNVSVVGVYIVLPEPLPPLDSRIVMTFSLPGEQTPVSCEGRIRWQNEPSIFAGCGRTKPDLPPGCGVEFLELDTRDRERIEARVRVGARHTGQ